MKSNAVRSLLLLPLALLMASSLAGCSKKVLDDRNTQVVNGKLYEKDADTPYTGTVTNVLQREILVSQHGYEQIFQLVHLAYGYNINSTQLFNIDGVYCDVGVTEGYLDGDAVCKVAQTDTVVAQITFDEGTLTGDFKYFDFEAPNNLIAEGKYSDGLPDGTITIHSEVNSAVILKSGFDKGNINGVRDDYDFSSGKQTAETHWKQGKLDGESKEWDASGVLTSDKTYKDGQRLSDQSPSAKPSNPIQRALEGDVAPATPASVMASSAPSTTVPAPAEASTSATQNPSTGNACLDEWEDAYRKERGADAVIAFDQIDEWTDECKQGKTAPKN